MRSFALRIIFLGLMNVWASAFQNTSNSPGTTNSPDTTKKEPPPVQILETWKSAEHRLTSIEPVRVSSRGQIHIYSSIRIQVVVDQEGNVVSATPLPDQEESSRKELYPAALAQAKTWKYRPFEQDGKPVKATFEEYVRILPPEELPKIHVPFPAIQNLKSLQITLQRTGCFGTCPAYTVEIHGDGTVLYRGNNYVLVMGEHRDQISKDSVSQLVDAFRKADYFSLRNQYFYSVTDNPTYKTSIAFDGHEKSVVDYVGEEAGMPHAVEELETLIDQVAGTSKWVQGNAETVPSLMREKWDFKSGQATSTLIEAACSQHEHTRMALLDLISAGVPADGTDTMGRTALGCAAAVKDDEAVALLIAVGAARGNTRAINQALIGAARAGDLKLVRLMLKYGADPNVAPEGETLLTAACRSGIPDVVSEVLKYHPDINAPDEAGRTAVHYASRDLPMYETDVEQKRQEAQRAEIVRILAKAGANLSWKDKYGDTPLHETEIEGVAEALIENGADVNARNDDGDTPLIKTWSPEIARLLIKAGADISAKNDAGRTAFDEAQHRNDKAKLEVLEQAQSGLASRP